MPFHEPDPADPSLLVGVGLPADEPATREMAVAFADEFARLGHGRDAILSLFRDPYYAGPHLAWRLLGERAIERIVDESVSCWSRYRVVVHDRGRPASGRARLVGRDGFLKVV